MLTMGSPPRDVRRLLYDAARRIALRVIPQPAPPIVWEGDFPDWEQAAAGCDGYDANAILGRVLDATNQVLSGDAAYERDGVAFELPDYSWAMLAGLLFAAAGTSRLHVADVGGSLGSTYLQHRTFFSDISDIDWLVIEQPGFVDAGRSHVEVPGLRFSSDIGQALVDSDVALFGSSLCYLPDPWTVLDRVEASSIEYLLIDRTPFKDPSDQDPSAHRIARQRVTGISPEHSERCESYPCWIFSQRALSDRLERTFESIAWWISDIQPQGGPTHRGCLWRRTA